MSEKIIRCPWANEDPFSQQYHDTVWGVPCHDERQLFKMLLLEGKQAGLSWVCILRKMETLCAAFDDFDPQKIADYDELKAAELLQNPGIIRNRLKVAAAVTNAKAYFTLCEKHGSLDRYIWSFTEGKQIINHWEKQEQMPATSPLSDTISKELKKQGFKFIGSTIIYSYLQAIGVINDHIERCAFRERK
ncbi:MAG: DNA-3-methyladenine glycosylase I [Clostridiales bacterium]|jgi:DNA-3-methyladenine glycosylase I|nr:DNA-3-methyladenine glycosylase I [Clostridiales bacterium]